MLLGALVNRDAPQERIICTWRGDITLKEEAGSIEIIHTAWSILIIERAK